MITVRDLQGKTVTTHSETMIRKAWVLQTPAALKAKFQAIVQPARFDLYNNIDALVRQEWTNLMASHREALAAKGIHPITDPVTGVSALPVEHQLDTEQILITAASNVLNSMG